MPNFSVPLPNVVWISTMLQHLSQSIFVTSWAIPVQIKAKIQEEGESKICYVDELQRGILLSVGMVA